MLPVRLIRFASSAVRSTKVAPLAATGPIGQPLSLLLKLKDDITHLSLYDLGGTPGVAADLGHINTSAKVTGHKGKESLGSALEGADIVVIPAGVPRKPGMTRDDLFNTNASIIAELSQGVAKYCPNAIILIIANPVNSTVPITAEVMKKAGVYNPKRLFGVTTLDVVRANAFVGASQGWSPKATDVTVIGGHAGITILPLLSQIKGAKLSAAEIEALTQRIQFGGDEVVKAKDGAGSATLSMAFAADRFVGAVLRARAGESVSECAFVQSTVVPGVAFFSTRVELDKTGGIARVNEIGAMSPFEKGVFDKMLPELKGSIDKGVEFASKWPAVSK